MAFSFQVSPDSRDPGVPPKPGPHYLTPHAAARYIERKIHLKISHATLYRMLADGRLYAIRVGYRYFIPLSSADDFLERCLRGDRQ